MEETRAKDWRRGVAGTGPLGAAAVAPERGSGCGEVEKGGLTKESWRRKKK